MVGSYNSTLQSVVVLIRFYNMNNIPPLCITILHDSYMHKGGVFIEFYTLILIGIGLSMDAFAASVCQGVNMKKIHLGKMIVISLFFSMFQAFMPLIGWNAGIRFENYIVRFDHWIAFALLSFLGVKMIIEVFSKDGQSDFSSGEFSMKELIILAVATSIDALAVGVTFAFLDTDIIFSVSVIGITTFFITFVGTFLGTVIGLRCRKKAEGLGGVILIFIGIKILIEHLLK